MLFTDDRGSLCVFVYIEGVEPSAVSLTEKYSTIELYATYNDVLPQLLYNLLECRIQHTTYLLSRGLLSDVSRSVSLLLSPLTINIALQPLGATPRTITLPFLIPIGKLV